MSWLLESNLYLANSSFLSFGQLPQLAARSQEDHSASTWVSSGAGGQELTTGLESSCHPSGPESMQQHGLSPAARLSTAGLLGGVVLDSSSSGAWGSAQRTRLAPSPPWSWGSLEQWSLVPPFKMGCDLFQSLAFGLRDTEQSEEDATDAEG